MQRSNMPTESDDWKGRLFKKKKRGKFILEYRIRPRESKASFFKRWGEWSNYFKKYKTAAQRKQAMDAMNKKNDLFEYRLPQGEDQGRVG